MGEYHEVTARPYLKIDPLDRQTVLAEINAASLKIESPVPTLRPEEIPDPKDLPFAEVAVASHAQFLVTGNKKHFVFLKTYGIPVVSPAEFIEKLGGEGIES